MTARRPDLAARSALRGVLAEFVGTGALLTAIVGSGIMAQRLSPGDVGLQLLENSIATAAALGVIIAVVGPVSGAHLNPAVTLVARFFGALTTRAAVGYITAQALGAASGTVVANLMFSLPAAEPSTTVRSGPGLWLGEVVATLGLLVVIFGLVRSGRTDAVPLAIAAYIGAAYWFTSSTSFANPAVTLGRTLTDTFAGIAPVSAPAFIAAELIGVVLAVPLIAVLFPRAAEQE